MDSNLIAFFQAAPPVIVGLGILYLIVRGIISLAEKTITALRDLGNKFFATINGYFAAMTDHNALTREAIRDSAALQQQALAKIAVSNESTGGNLERMATLLTAINQALDDNKTASEQNKSEILEAVNTHSDTLIKQGETLMNTINPVAEKVDTGFGEVKDILGKIDDKLDANSAALVKQLADQFKPIFDEMLTINRTAAQLSQELSSVQVKIEESSARLEQTFLTTLAGIVKPPPVPTPSDFVNNGTVNGAVQTGEVQP